MRNFRWMAGLMLVLALLHWPEAAIRGAQQAMAHWYASVAPSLFPFMALMPMLTCREAAQAYERLLGRCMQWLFRLPGPAAAAFAIGMVAGSPAGAVAARRIAARSGMNQGQLQRLVIAICGLSPAFIISGIGVSLLNSAAQGHMLLRTQLITQLFMAFILRGAWKNRTQPVPEAKDGGDEQPVRAAVLAILTVCGYMALFGAFAQIACEIVGAGIGNALLCILDMPSGARVVTQSGLGASARLVLLAAMSGFSGICICAQNLSVLEGCGIHKGEFYALRALAALMSGGVMAVQMYVPWEINVNIVPRPLYIAALIAVLLIVPAINRIRKSIY